MPKHYRSGAQVKALLRRKGIRVTDLAAELAVHPNSIHEVLAGRSRGISGDAHKIAITLGIKVGEIVTAGQTIVESLRADRADA